MRVYSPGSLATGRSIEAVTKSYKLLRAWGETSDDPAYLIEMLW